MRIGTRLVFTVGAFAAALTAGIPRAAADPVTVAAESLALRAGKEVSLGSNVSVDAAIAAGTSVSAGQGATLGDIYAGTNVWLDRYATVRGTVLANGSANADQGLDLIGSWTGKSVYFARDAKVVGNVTGGAGNVSIDRNASITGNIVSNRSVWIDRDSTIDGDARAGLTGSLGTGHNVSISGSRDRGSFGYDSFSLPSMGDQPQAGNVGSQSVWAGRNSSTSLDPGEYRNLGFDRGATVNLSAGQYTLKEFWIDRDGVVNVDTTGGDVVLNVTGTFGTGRDTVFNKTGDGKLIINVFDSNVWLGQGNQIEAAISVWGGSFGADQGTKLTGNVAATGDIWFGNGSQIIFSAFGQGAEVPEPTALAIVVMGGVLTVMRRRHHGWSNAS